MAKRPEETNPYTKRPLYIYDLPPELIETLTLHTTSAIGQISTEEQPEQGPVSRAVNEDGVSTSTACTLCKATFRDVSDQRQHVRSDFHKYNLKLQLKQLPPIDEATFVKKIGELDESISGSESSESEDEEENANPNDTTLSALLKRQARIAHQDEEGGQVPLKKRGPGNAPMYWLTSPKLPEGIGLGVYRAILSNDEQESAHKNLLDILKKKQIQPVHAKQSSQNQITTSKSFSDPHFFLCMIGGGHFAAAIIGLAPEIRKGPGGVEERHAVVKAHKTFHRYTTRRKQGGSQSANDNAKGNAHSVGSSIRRANEAALEMDIRNLLSEWKGMIDSAELVFIRATGSQNRRILFGPYDGQVLTSRDKRLRSFPFSTKRATQNELIRAFQELTRAKVDKLIEEEPEKTTEQPKVQKPKPQPAKPTPEQEEALLHTSQLQNLIRRSKAPGVLLYLKKNNLSANYPFYPPDQGTNHHAPTPLHLAASQNAAAVVTALLTKADADPTIKNADGKVPYDIAGDSRTHDAFRVARHTLGEKAHDWSAAHVPTPLTPEEAEAKSKREASEANTAEAEHRKADLERIKQEEEDRKLGKIEKKAGTGKALGAVPDKSWTEKNEEDLRGLTPEMRQRLERERRARAAEARMKALGGK
ncbi:hypothetical protein PMZ80_001928 [Knufia obscura]|uniref:VLRF1 domain-containing protein n=1 Tax=Knufia obscura TaxID=1635080 RepID=A0ABR0RVV3_9EURO|nr:hypothetical protein PMZ80_001928 [Knufia obscura]